MTNQQLDRKAGFIKQAMFLEELSKLNIVRICGSFARGEQNVDSDIDFKIKDSPKDEMYGDKNRYVEKVKELLAKYNYQWKSTRPGYMTTNSIPRDDNNYLLLHMEFSPDFYQNKNKLKEVEILGSKFKTW